MDPRWNAVRLRNLNRFNSLVYNYTLVVSPTKVTAIFFHVDAFLDKIPAFPENKPTTVPDVGLTNELRFPTLLFRESQ